MRIFFCFVIWGLALKATQLQAIDRRPGIMPGEPSMEPTGDQREVYLEYERLVQEELNHQR